MTDPSDLYTAEWVAHDFEHLQPEFNLAADALFTIFVPHHVLDVGCGPGMLVGGLNRHPGVTCVGFDGSRHCIEYASPFVRPYLECLDLLTPGLVLSQLVGEGYDLILCTEVAEHLEPEHADRLVELLCEVKPNSIVFTAAPPGQDGHHHVNCQPPEYWQRKFWKHRYGVDQHVTDQLKVGWQNLSRLSHMRTNVMVFR